MTKLTDVDYVHIRKGKDPIVLESYELTYNGYQRPKFAKKYRYWRTYMGYKKAFLVAHEKVRKELLDTGFCPRHLWEEYEELRADFFTAHGIVERDFKQRAI